MKTILSDFVALLFLGMLFASSDAIAGGQQAGMTIMGFFEESDSSISAQKMSLLQKITEEQDKIVMEKIMALQDRQLKAFDQKIDLYSRKIGRELKEGYQTEIEKVKDNFQIHVIIAFYTVAFSLLLTVLGFLWKVRRQPKQDNHGNTI